MNVAALCAGCSKDSALQTNGCNQLAISEINPLGLNNIIFN